MARRADEGTPIIGLAYDLCAALYEQVNRAPFTARSAISR